MKFDVCGRHVRARAGRAALDFIDGQEANDGRKVLLFFHGLSPKNVEIGKGAQSQ